MKITLSYAEGRSCISRLPDRLAVELREGRKHTWGRSHVYLLPPIGWKLVLDSLRAVAYGPRGGYKHQAPSLYTAIAKIADTVRTWELHPAFVEGRGVVGVTGEVVPAFLIARRRSPYPPGEFVTLMPHHVLDRGRTLTVWRPGDYSGKDPLCSEGFHTGVFIEVLRDVPEL